MVDRKIRYTYRLRPSVSAEQYLVSEWGKCRFVWNMLVAESRHRHSSRRSFADAGIDTTWWDAKHEKHRESFEFGAAEADKLLTLLRRNTSDAETGHKWLAEGSSVAQQQTVRDFSAARQKAVMDRKNKIPVAQRRGLPNFKSKDTARASMNYTSRGFSLEDPGTDSNYRLILPGGASIPVVTSRRMINAAGSVRVYQDSLGHWYASFTTTEPFRAMGAPHLDSALGVDWGVTETATTAVVDTSTGAIDEAATYDLPHHEYGKRNHKEVVKAERRLARRRKPKGHRQSHGYRKAKFLAARAKKKAARQRKDTANKWAKKTAVENPRIAVEDFRPRFLSKTTMAKKAADAAISATKTALIWQATKSGTDVRLVHPANTTTDCANCDARTKHRLPLGQRTYTCQECGVSRPRDKNSAAVMVARAGFAPASAEGMKSSSPAAVQEAA